MRSHLICNLIKVSQANGERKHATKTRKKRHEQICVDVGTLIVLAVSITRARKFWLQMDAHLQEHLISAKSIICEPHRPHHLKNAEA